MQFTQESVQQLLDSEVLKNGWASRLNPTPKQVGELAAFLENLRLLASGRDEAGHEEDDNHQLIEALQVMLRILPDRLAEHRAIASSMTKWSDDSRFRELVGSNASQNADADVVAIEGLLTAIESFRNRGLPHRPILSLSAPVEEWKGYAPHVLAYWTKHFPTQAQDAAFRLIAAISETMTGSPVKFSTVQTAFKKGEWSSQ
ncbi:hypothetical protein QA646_17775 [Rhizobium sp. CB3090]|uniref:hypothetical protein n=1 Tax=Rhizobium sp. CB3090 TaxID=3039156 RepID=UPI0024B1CFC4|nr:hypothetical protein [Rhizobium sp. CB3090]WFU09095.1 hypothetical protein QA646_17775 [Rhizobium sp. CB3090]